jgi:hypothetical protein
MSFLFLLQNLRIGQWTRSSGGGELILVGEGRRWHGTGTSASLERKAVDLTYLSEVREGEMCGVLLQRPRGHPHAGLLGHPGTWSS